MTFLKTYDSVPFRPTARIDLLFDPVERAVLCTVIEGSNESVVLKCSDSGILFQSGRDEWLGFRPGPSRLSTPAGAACLAVLKHSDVFCPSQAISDFPAAASAPIWEELLEDIVALLPVAAVMLS